MAGPRFCLPIDCWPEVDRQRWWVARTSPEFLERDRSASHWSPDRRTIAERASGCWLCFLKRKGGLNPSCMPGDRATDGRLAGVRGRAASCRPERCDCRSAQIGRG
jgi:hypothetical protein